MARMAYFNYTIEFDNKKEMISYIPKYLCGCVDVCRFVCGQESRKIATFLVKVFKSNY